MDGICLENMNIKCKDIKTKSIEYALVPLLSQLTTLVNHGDRLKLPGKKQSIMQQVGQSVNEAVVKFVSIGHSIAKDQPECRKQMEDACSDAKDAGKQIEEQAKLCDQHFGSSSLCHSEVLIDQSVVVKAVHRLMSAVTAVLLLADRIVVKQLLSCKDRVLQSLHLVENVSSFQEFVPTFSQFGKRMVMIAHQSGDRQNDLKCEKHRTQIASARAVLEKSMMMLLTSCKTSFRHPGCVTARQNRDCVFLLIRWALDRIQQAVADGDAVAQGSCFLALNADFGSGFSSTLPVASKAFMELEDSIKRFRHSATDIIAEDELWRAFDVVKETVDDFTDSPYTLHSRRQCVVRSTERLRSELQTVTSVRQSTVAEVGSAVPALDLPADAEAAVETCISLRKQLLESAMAQASELFRCDEVLIGLRAAGMEGNRQSVDRLVLHFSEYRERVTELCKLFRHLSSSDVLVATADHHLSLLHHLGPMTALAAHTLADNPSSVVAGENFEVFAGAWRSENNDLSVFVREVSELADPSGQASGYPLGPGYNVDHRMRPISPNEGLRRNDGGGDGCCRDARMEELAVKFHRLDASREHDATSDVLFGSVHCVKGSRDDSIEGLACGAESINSHAYGADCMNCSWSESSSISDRTSRGKEF